MVNNKYRLAKVVQRSARALAPLGWVFAVSGLAGGLLRLALPMNGYVVGNMGLAIGAQINQALILFGVAIVGIIIIVIAFAGNASNPRNSSADGRPENQ